MSISRRSFLKNAAAASAAPFILPSAVWSADRSPNDRLVMGFIGTGKQSRGLLGAFLNHRVCQVVAVCDVDTTRRTDAQQRVNEFYTARPDRGTPDCGACVDFREIISRDDIDAVCIATPDHWHTIPVIAALQSGKDVYCEKPLTHNVKEAIAIMDAVEKYERVLQTGSMQRSMKEFRVACELVRNGAIGKISRVECSFGPPGVPCDLPEEEMEPGLDWDMWLGPAPERPYHSELSPRGMHDHFPNWRNYREYGGGMVTDWGAHHLDIAQWGLGKDASGPDEIHPPEDSEAKSGATLFYDNAIKVVHTSGFGVHFFGEDGEVKVNRGKFEFWRDGEKLAGFVDREDGGSLGATLSHVEEEYLKDAKVKLYESPDHIRNFLDCVESREKPVTSEIVGGRSAICCHLMNQAYYNHEVIKWNPEEMCFAENSGNPEWLTREYREPWKI
ncbi:MAG TPA: Gfo/Idh/MocA family oxidoreductase [Candidatus Hydrogenedentes bacterium]|nr:Gfo/Idh/MocA family oxidoreductase [Candidatus Hydrogenedentota bacterium]